MKITLQQIECTVMSNPIVSLIEYQITVDNELNESDVRLLDVHIEHAIKQALKQINETKLCTDNAH